METFWQNKLNGQNGEIKTQSTGMLPRFYSLASINLDFKNNTPDDKKARKIFVILYFLIELVKKNLFVCLLNINHNK